jgi:hypothetical protein
MKTAVGILLTAAAAAFLIGDPQEMQNRAGNDHFDLLFGSAGVTSLKRSQRSGETDFLSPGRTLGDIVLRYRMLDLEWQDFVTGQMAETRTFKQGGEASGGQRIIVYNGSGWYDYYASLEFTSRLRLEGKVLYWTLHLRNVTHKPVEIGNFYLPLPFGTDGSLKRNAVLAGHSSSVTWSPAQGAGPHLVMTPIATCPLFEPAQTERNFAAVGLERADDGGVYIHAALVEQPGSGDGAVRYPQGTSYRLTPKFTPGDEITYGFKFQWADDEEERARILYEEGLFDIRITPGSTVAAGAPVTIALHSKNTVRSMEAEEPDQAVIRDRGRDGRGARVFEVTFVGPGPKTLRVRYDGNRTMPLVFHVTS